MAPALCRGVHCSCDSGGTLAMTKLGHVQSDECLRPASWQTAPPEMCKCRNVPEDRQDFSEGEARVRSRPHPFSPTRCSLFAPVTSHTEPISSLRQAAAPTQSKSVPCHPQKHLRQDRWLCPASKDHSQSDQVCGDGEVAIEEKPSTNNSTG